MSRSFAGNVIARADTGGTSAAAGPAMRKRNGNLQKADNLRENGVFGHLGLVVAVGIVDTRAPAVAPVLVDTSHSVHGLRSRIRRG